MPRVTSIRFTKSESASAQKSGGVHYTPPALAAFVAKQIALAWEGNNPRVLDPAVGDGELLIAMASVLGAGIYLHGYDTSEHAVNTANSRLRVVSPASVVDIQVQDFIAVAGNSRPDDLFGSGESFDIAIANPPYVRTQVMGAVQSQLLAQQFELAGRVDLYFAFIEGIGNMLRPGGVAGIIVSNRFMTTKAGATVRRRLLEVFDVLQVWDLGDTKLFEAAVLPAVLLLRKKAGNKAVAARFTSVYSTATLPERAVASIFDAITVDGCVEAGSQCYQIRHGLLDHGPTPDGVWKISTPVTDAWLAAVQANTHCTFGGLGKIRVGVKTTADKVFVRTDWDTFPAEERPELLRPLLTHHIARQYRSEQPNRQILYTHQACGKRKVAIELDCYPRAKQYLEGHRTLLEGRTYVIESGRKWYEIWVPQNPAAWPKPKLVFPDITEKPTFWMDLDGSVVNGDCYWLTLEDDKNIDLLWLALAVANSTFIEEFYDHRFHNKLYAGRRRFMTQYVELFPLPNPSNVLAQEIVRDVKRRYDLPPGPEAAMLEEKLDRDVRVAFGVAVEEGTR